MCAEKSFYLVGCELCVTRQIVEVNDEPGERHNPNPCSISTKHCSIDQRADRGQTLDTLEFGSTRVCNAGHKYLWELGIQLTNPGWVIAQIAAQGERLRETSPDIEISEVGLL